MGKSIKCPWCGESTAEEDVRTRTYSNSYGEVKERKCCKCGGILAAYLIKEPPFAERVRVFKD